LSANEGTFTPPPALRAFPAVAAVLMPFVALLFRPDFIRLAEGRSSVWAVSSDGSVARIFISACSVLKWKGLVNAN